MLQLSASTPLVWLPSPSSAAEGMQVPEAMYHIGAAAIAAARPPFVVKSLAAIGVFARADLAASSTRGTILAKPMMTADGLDKFEMKDEMRCQEIDQT